MANVAMAMEPASWIMVGFGLVGGGFLQKRRLPGLNLVSPAQTSTPPQPSMCQALRNQAVRFLSTSQAGQGRGAHFALRGHACASVAAAVLLLLTAKAASADTISFNSQTVSSIAFAPSADTLSLDSDSGQIDTTVGAFALQTGDFVIGSSDIPDQDISFSFQDTLTINGITQTLTFNGQDAVTQTADTLTILGGAPVVFGDEVLSVQDFNLSEANLGDFPVNIEATVTPTPEPSSLLLLGSGIVLGALVLARKNSKNHA